MILTVKSIAKNSIAKKLKIKIGDKLTKINGVEVVDILDYLYLEGETKFSLTLISDGNCKTIDIVKDIYEPIGLDFYEDFTIRTCQNKCVFCFVDQMASNMRETLYCKDDDYRLSFISGSYVTLTNDKVADIDRIIRLKLSPLYISVHATDAATREKLLNNRFAGNILEQLKRLTDNGIEAHTQVVLCPELNDGEILNKTIEDLFSFYPKVKSLAIVPVGMTKFRDDLPKIKAVDKLVAEKVIESAEKYAEKFYNICGERFVYCSDEFYAVAEKDIPNEDFYDGYPQIENGVGLIRKFTEEFNSAIYGNKKFSKKSTLLITGKSFYPYLKGMLDKIDCPHKLKMIENDFFGHSVTVAGLLTGKDIINQVKNEKFERIILPQNVLKEFGDVFLDNITLKDFEKELNAKAVISPNDGALLYKLL